MTDEEVESLLPVVDEFISAVADEDAGFISACLSFEGRAPAIAVLCAARVLQAEADAATARGAVRDARHQYAAALAANQKLSTEVAELRQARDELRGYLAAGRRTA